MPGIEKTTSLLRVCCALDCDVNVPRPLDNIGPRGERGAAVLKLGYMAEERQECGAAAEDRNTTSAPLRRSHAAPSTINFKKLHLR